jgi:hypothetical protein
MSQPQTQNILGAQPYRNPRHAQDAMDLEEYEKSNQNSNAQEAPATDLGVKPEHNWEKRYKDLQSYTAKKINTLESQVQEVMQQGVKRIEAPKTPEELEAFKGQNPETYAVIQSMADSLFQSHMTKYDQQLAEMQGTLQVSAQEKAMLKLKEAHSDYETIMNSDAFHDWVSTQPTQVQDWVYKNPDNADLAIQALSLFKYHSGWGKNTKGTTNTQGNSGGDVSVNTRNNKVEPGATDKNHPAYMWKESEIASMRPEVFQKWDEHITLAQRENRILFGQ